MPEEHNKIETLKDDLYRRNPVGTSYTPHDIKREPLPVRKDWNSEAQKQAVPSTETHDDDHPLFDKWLKIMLTIGTVVFLVAIGFAGYRFITGLNVVDESKVSIEIKGPVSIKGGDTLDLGIVIKNNNEIQLEAVKLVVEYPVGARVASDIQSELTRKTEELGVLGQGKTVETEHSAILFGAKDSVQNIVVKLEWRVEGSNKTFSKKETYPVTIVSSPLIMTIQHEEEVNSGQEVSFIVTLTSNSIQPIENLLLTADYPFAFEFRDASPPSRFGNNVWDIGTIKPGEKQTISIVGRIGGQENEERVFRFNAGEASRDDGGRSIAASFISSQEEIVVKRPFVDLSFSVNNNEGQTHVARMGERNQFQVKWKNKLDSTLSDVVIRVKLTGDSVQETTVSVGSGGFYNSINDTITWTKNNNPSLRSVDPGESGFVTFSFATVSPSPSVVADFQNPQIDVEVELVGERFREDAVESEQVVVNTNGDIKILSELALTSRMVHNDGPFVNSGPVPPIAETETTYTVLWSITNAFNDVENTEVRASLPSYVEWKGVKEPSSEDFVYLPDTREVVWRLGFVKAGTGLVERSKDIAFQIGFLPSQGQVGSAPDLVLNITATGRDTFTGKTLSKEKNSLTTNITTDSKYRKDFGSVKDN